MSEVACDMHYLMGRASRDGHEVGQRLASEVKAKLESAIAQAPAVRVTATKKKHDGPCWRNSHSDCGC